MNLFELQAHRGVSTEYPENTMSAYEAAVMQGYEIIEVDLNVTLDGKVVALHDETINRTARYKDGSKIQEPIKVAELTYDQLLAYDFGIWFSDKFKGEKIPLFSEVLKLAEKSGVLIKIDNKFQKFDQRQMEVFLAEAEKTTAHLAFTCNNMEFIEMISKRFPNAQIHYDGKVDEETLKEISQIVPKNQLVVWLPYKSKLTSWVKIPFVSKELAKLVKGYARLGVWILSDEKQLFDAVNNYGADIIETTGSIKPTLIDLEE